jgi:hypothetical protein
VPHSLQNFAPVPSFAPHDAQVACSRAPHSAQNFAPGGFSCGQTASFTDTTLTQRVTPRHASARGRLTAPPGLSPQASEHGDLLAGLRDPLYEDLQ